ncbi:MAG: cofactor-independent phosphoglycerate mutase [Methanobacteriaceae archaeon]|nr:cofactor-independent phosphoglycerate mutase [Methanobacteriaceae archaeon]
MKYIVIIGDGMADYPLDELDHKTPLQSADIPNMDHIASKGVNGFLRTIPPHMEPGSDVANLAIMGYNPKTYYTGRGPLEAASIGVEIENDDVAFRCNLITEEDGLLIDFNADHISTPEAEKIIETLNHVFKDNGKFYNGVSYRNLFLYKNKKSALLKSTPPHDVVGENIKINLIQPFDNEIAQELNNIMTDSKLILEKHPVNQARVRNGKKPANMVWLWGQGLKPLMNPFKSKYGLDGATITGVDLIKGIGIYLGLENIDVPGATGYFDTDYNAKAEYALKGLKHNDIIFIHVEAPDEAGHAGDIEEKIKAIESIDSKIVGKLLDELPQFNDYAVSILPDHATPIMVKTHTDDPVPYAMMSTSKIGDEVRFYDEFSARGGSLDIRPGHEFINSFINYSNSP